MNRIKYYDIAKGIAMLCIILGHLGISQVNNIVFTFHVPIFFIISGIFMSEKGTWREFAVKRAKGLLVPYVLTCVTLCVVGLAWAVLKGEDLGAQLCKWSYAAAYGAGNTYYEPFYIPEIGAIWFLLASFWASIMLKWIITKDAKLQVLVVVVVFFVSAATARYIWLPLSVQAGGIALFYMYLGFLYKRYRERIHAMGRGLQILAILLALGLWIWCITHFTGFYIVSGTLGNGLIDIVGSICGSAIVILLSNWIERYMTRTSQVLSWVGEHSLLILCVHIVELTFFPWHIITNRIPGTLGMCIVIVGKFILIFVIVEVIGKLKDLSILKIRKQE